MNSYRASFQVLHLIRRYLNTTTFYLLAVLFIVTVNYLVSRPIKLHWSEKEAYLMRFQWLESVNLYLKTGKILMLPPGIRLEDGSPGEDQGYPFILSMLGKLSGIPTMDFGHFIRFNYLLLVVLGLLTSISLYLSFQSQVLSAAFYIFYLRTDIYSGGIDHHWMLGAYVPFYLTFLVIFIINRIKLKPIWFIVYFLVAGMANIVREGDGLIAILLFGATLVILSIQKSYKKHTSQIYQKIGWVILFAFIYNLPWLVISGVREYRNRVYFNYQSSDMITHHGIWHNAFMGLSYTPNPYGIIWTDANNLPFVQRVSPETRYMTNEYFTILRGLYFKILWDSPGFWIRNQLAKIKTLNEYLASLFPHNFPLPVPEAIKPFTFYLLIAGMYLIARKRPQQLSIFFLTLATLGAAALPGFIGIPMKMFLRGLVAAYFMVWIMLFAFLHTRINEFLIHKHD